MSLEQINRIREEARRKAEEEFASKNPVVSPKPSVIRSVETGEIIDSGERGDITYSPVTSRYINVQNNVVPCPRLNIDAPSDKDEPIKSTIKCELSQCINCKNNGGTYILCRYQRRRPEF